MEAPLWEPGRNESLPPTLSPAVPPYVKLGLTAVYTAFYALLFVFIYAQLWLVLRYRHKRLSYQSVFLFLCLFWASLRTVLFSFYFRDFVAANSFSPFVFWLLYCFPVCLQFFTLTLMNLYFTQVSPERRSPAGVALHPPGEGVSPPPQVERVGPRRGSRGTVPAAGPHSQAIPRRAPGVFCAHLVFGAGGKGCLNPSFPLSPLLISRHPPLAWKAVCVLAPLWGQTQPVGNNDGTGLVLMRCDEMF